MPAQIWRLYKMGWRLTRRREGNNNNSHSRQAETNTRCRGKIFSETRQWQMPGLFRWRKAFYQSRGEVCANHIFWIWLVTWNLEARYIKVLESPVVSRKIRTYLREKIIVEEEMINEKRKISACCKNRFTICKHTHWKK